MEQQLLRLFIQMTVLLIPREHFLASYQILIYAIKLLCLQKLTKFDLSSLPSSPSCVPAFPYFCYLLCSGVAQNSSVVPDILHDC